MVEAQAVFDITNGLEADPSGLTADVKASDFFHLGTNHS